MSEIVLNGHPTWARISERRAPRLVLLHGGMSSSASLLRTMAPHLEKRFSIAAFDRRGHGRTRDLDMAFHYESMADEAIAFLEYLGGAAHLLGHSDGATVALLVALRRPDLVRRVVAVGANFHHSGVIADGSADFESTAFKEWAEQFGSQSPDGALHARAVVEKALVLFASEPTLTTTDLADIDAPVLVMAGDDDAISLGHTCALFEALSEAQLSIVPGTSHALLKERPKECARIIRRFLTMTLPPVTQQPVRRATSAEAI